MKKMVYNAHDKNIDTKHVDLTLDDQLDRMREYLKGEKKAKSGRVRVLTEQSIISKTEAVRSCVKAAGPCTFDKVWIATVNKKLEENGRSPSTAMAYSYAMQDFYESNGYHGFDFPYPQLITHEAKYHTKAEIERIIKCAVCDRDTAILTVLYYAALRSKELRYLHVKDVDLKARLVHVRDHAGIKGKAERTIPIPPRAIPAIEAWLKERNETVRKHPELESLPYMFFSQTGELITLPGLGQMVVRTGKIAGISTHPHAFRHARASYLVNEGDMKIHQAQKILGHRSILTTQKYCHADLKTLADSIDRIEG